MATHRRSRQHQVRRRLRSNSDSDDDLFFSVDNVDNVTERNSQGHDGSLSGQGLTRRDAGNPLKGVHSEITSASGTSKGHRRSNSGGEIANSRKYDGVPASTCRETYRERISRMKRQNSIVDNLLFDIYDRWQYGRDSFDSDTFTEGCSSTASEAFFCRHDSQLSECDRTIINESFLSTKDIPDLKKMVTEMKQTVSLISARLVRQLKRRDRRLARTHKNCDLITAVLQASSLKRRIDTRIKFSLEPMGGDDAFQQWHDAMKAVARLPLGIPSEFRKKVWLSLADNHIKSIQIDWEKTKRFCFNERSNPDDNKLGIQIVKDLHRTGCSGFSGQDNEQDRAVLKRVLLAYARWNKHVGYCQGFNVLAALILEVMERREDDTLKVMIFLIDHVLPDSYFANNLRALSVDMAVFRDLLRFRLHDLSKHLDYLQTAARDKNSGTSYEPPLTNVFTMQWFLTMFATCLPKPIVLRVWDSIFLEGSEILLRAALGIWEKLADRIMSVESADEFYSTMGVLTQDMLDSDMFDPDRMMKNVYSMAPFPHPQVKELREKYTYNITPFTAAMSTGGRRSARGILFSDDDDIEDEDLEAVSCFTGILGPQNFRGRSESGEAKVNHADISNVSPGAYAANPHEQMQGTPFMERMTTDIDALRKQYEKLRQRQQQAHVILAAANARHNAKNKIEAAMMPKIESPTVAMNHLFVTKGRGNKNRHVTEGPRIAIMGAPMVKAQLRLTHPQRQANRSRRLSQSDETCSMSSVTTEEPCSISEAGTYCQDRDESEVTSIVSSGDLESRVSEPESKISVGSDGEVISGGASVVPSVGSDGSDSAGDLRSSSSDNGVIKEKLLKDKCNLQSQIQLQSLHGQSCHLQEIRDGFVVPTRRTDYSASGTSDDQETDQDGDLPLEEQAKQEITAAYITTLTYKSHKSAHDKTSPLPSYTPSPVESPTKEKIHNPFPVRYASQQRHKNGVKLGLYDPGTPLQDYEESPRQRPSHSKGISRAHINMCLHRQYMAEVRESAKKTKR